MQILDRIQNKIGTFWGTGTVPTAGSKQAVVAADMPASEAVDATNYLRLSIYADFGAGPRFMARGPDFHGGPGQSAPSLAWGFDPAVPPLFVYGVLENGTAGNGSPAVCGLTITFA